MPEPDSANAHDLALLERAVRAAGDIARSFFGGAYERWSKPGGSPVTEADLAVDRFLKETLLAARPAYGWLSEESANDPARLTARRIFIVDPIDGTVAFLKGRPHFTICAAVVEAERPRAAAVFNPMTEECFLAAEGRGATLNGAPIHVRDRDRLEGMAMLGARDCFAAGWPPMTVTSFSSIAYRIVLVADGRHDATLALSAKRDWDLAAADLVLTEAGGRISDARGGTLLYNTPAAAPASVVAAGPQLHALLIARLRQKEG